MENFGERGKEGTGSKEEKKEVKEEEEEEEEVEGEAKFQCKICLEDKSARAFYNLSQCNHQYCKSVSFFLTLSHLSLSPPSHPLTPRYFPLRLPSILLPSPFFSFFVFCQYPFSSKSIEWQPLSFQS